MKVQTRRPTRREHALGIALSISVAAVWVLSSELIQYIFGSEAYKPCLLTYLTAASFSALLLGFVRPSWRAKLHAISAKEGAAQYTPVSGVVQREHTHNVRDVMRVAAIIMPLFFMANYTFNAGLGKTSVASSSTISTLSSLFTLFIGAVAGNERFSFVKLFASLVTVTGVAVISGIDGKNGQFLGDALSIVGAFLFGLYTTALKVCSPDGMDMAMMFGFMGLFAAFSLWPLFPILNITKIESFALPSWRALGLLLINAAFGSVLSDYLWAKSVVLTSALAATIGLALSVPFSLVFDTVVHKMKLTPVYLLGVFLVLSGFIVVNIELASGASLDIANEEDVLSIQPEQTLTEEADEELQF